MMLLFPSLARSQTAFRNSGKMHIGKGSPGISGLYVPGNLLLTDSSAIRLNGLQHLDGDLVGNRLAANAHGFDPAGSSGKLLMKGARRQRITSNGLACDRTGNYLSKIPVLEISNRAGVHLSDSVALTVDTLSLRQGKFILGSRFINGNETRLAHFLVRDSVLYNRQDTAVVEIEMVIGNSGKGREGKFMGFSPPFKRMYADYFMYNYLLAPDKNGLGGATGNTIPNADYPLEAGRGYIVGQNVYGLSSAGDYGITPGYNVDYNSRMRDTLILNRYSLTGIRVVDVTGYPISQADAYTGEALNTGNVTVPLKAGYNYLGNPYTCPLDLSGLKQDKATADSWGVSRNASTANVDIHAGFWILRNGARIDSTVNFGNKSFSISVSYDVSQLVGSTVSADSVAPMQLFVVYAYRDCNLTIPAAARTHRNTNFLKNGNILSDELLLEVKDLTTEGFDRMCVVFRNGASTGATDAYDAYKLINTSRGVSQIYTTSPDNADLITSVVPRTQESLPLTLIPPAVEQEAELTASRLETLVSPEAVQLEDLKTGSTVDLTKQSYRFTTAPNDNPNRFILHFRDVLGMATGLESSKSFKSLSILSRNNELVVQGLEDIDTGSQLQIYDMQGRLLKQATVTQIPEMQLSLSLSEGVYIARLQGKRSITLKFRR
jgi:hypothetical protein